MLELEAPARPGALVETRISGTGALPLDLDLLLSLPGAPAPPAGHPVVLFLHGRGERRTLGDVGTFGPPMLARTHAGFPWAVIAPRCPPERGWESQELVVLLDDLLGRLPLDPDRVVVTGLSMGGYGTWSLLLAHPDRFAAAVPICGGAPASVVSLITPERLDLIRAVPVRAFHGARDAVVPVSESAAIADELRARGCDVELTVYPDVGHDSWTRAYADPGLWAWLAERRRASG